MIHYYLIKVTDNTLNLDSILETHLFKKKEIDLNKLIPVNHEIESRLLLESFQLVEDYKKGILKGKLKEIASKLDEEDNPVIMLIKHKK